jgi:hypothetical protein
MNVALIGASGNVGSRILAELLRRGHTVTGIARGASKVVRKPGLAVKTADARDAAKLAPLLVGHDAVISATKIASSDPKALLSAIGQAGAKRLLVVGGAGSLEIAPGKALVDMPRLSRGVQVRSAGRPRIP